MKETFHTISRNIKFAGRIHLCISVLILFTCSTFAQKKKLVSTLEPFKIVSFELLENGDTINKLDNKNRKWGKWLIVNKGGYGEEDFMELGSFDDDVRTGVWKSYTMNGTIISQEFFKQGNKSGEARYYDDGFLFCVGNYLALRSKYDYDTIMVEDPNTGMEKPVILKSDVGSVRHGFWTYYNTPTTDVKKVLEYQVDEVIYEKEYTPNVRRKK
jgi:antitoxin component YwqK of YwqJK toxin-antitoxin module